MMNRSEFVTHEPCPECGSKDNLGVWTDHKWCFGCGHYEPVGDRLHSMKKSMSHNHMEDVQDDRGKPLWLPADCSNNFSERAKNWMASYRITQEDIAKHKITYSNNNHYLIFPVYGGEGDLLMWQARIFDPREPKLRYYTRGIVEDVYHIMEDKKTNFLVLVEDMVSAITVSKVASVMPLFGSHISDNRVSRLSKMYDKVVLWLDPDKKAYSMEFRLKKYEFFRDGIGIITSAEDPKMYDPKEVRTYLSSYLS